MKKVKMLRNTFFESKRFSTNAKEPYEVGDLTAQMWIENGIAELVDVTPTKNQTAQTASVPPKSAAAPSVQGNVGVKTNK